MPTYKQQIKMRTPFYRKLRTKSYVVRVDVHIQGSTPENRYKQSLETFEYLIEKQDGDWRNDIEERRDESIVKSMAILDRETYQSTIERLSTARWTKLPRSPDTTTMVIVHHSEPTKFKKKEYRNKRRFRHVCTKCGHVDEWGGEPNGT